VSATRPRPTPEAEGLWFTDDSTPPVRGFLHTPDAPSGDALVLTHGAGSDCQSPLLVVVATAFAEGGFTVLRCDLPYRQKRRLGPPFRGEDRLDRKGLRNAIAALNQLDSKPHRVFLGGHSYGGRQASLLVAEDASAADGLLLLSYPLHPPRRPAQLRTTHFPALREAALFVHGTRDPFASSEEIRAAIELIPARTSLVSFEGAGHSLLSGKSGDREQLRRIAAKIRDTALTFFGKAES
jgi:predicted alpha/beta-hydrolase family hydrolase